MSDARKGPFEAVGNQLHDGDGLLAEFGFSLRPEEATVEYVAKVLNLFPRLVKAMRDQQVFLVDVLNRDQDPRQAVRVDAWTEKWQSALLAGEELL